MQRKNLLCIFIVLVWILTSSFSYASTIELEVSKSEALEGEEVILQVIGKDLTDIVGANIIINYENSKLTLQSKTINIDDTEYINLQIEGTSLEDSDGQAKIVFGLKKDSTPITNSESTPPTSTLATLIFTTTDIGEVSFALDGESKLVVDNGSDVYTYDDITLGESVNLVIVKLGSISGNIAFDDGYTASGEEVKLYKNDQISKTVIINNDGTYSFENLEDGAYLLEVSVPGYEEVTPIEITVDNNDIINQNFNLNRIYEDVSRDGAIDLADLVLIGGKFDLTNLDAEFIKDADINGDNIIDLLDLIRVARKIQ